MKQHDTIQRFLFEDRPVRGQFVRLQAAYQKAMEQHHYPPLLQNMLAEALLAVTLLYGLTRGHGKMSIQFSGDGDLELLSAHCSGDYDIRGMASWHGNLASEEQLNQALKDGQLMVTFIPETDAAPYQSIIQVGDEGIAKAMETYFARSEQLLTRFYFAVGGNAAVGMVLQVMPENLETVSQSWEHVCTIADTLRPRELLSVDNRTVLKRLYHQDAVRLFQAESVRFNCGCSIEKMRQAIITMGRKEVDQLLEDVDELEIACEFCGNEYGFDRVDIEQIWRTGPKVVSPTMVVH